uniref:CSON013358 protein n=1 Tax=Culicoides sonorensis TaxID=179676 RepID=A0A336M7R5_CULSO
MYGKKTSTTIKEGYLMKQTWSFQRWKRRYFKLKGNILYYAKDHKITSKLETLSLDYRILMETTMISRPMPLNFYR